MSTSQPLTPAGAGGGAGDGCDDGAGGAVAVLSQLRRRRVFTPTVERTERMHRFTGRLRAAVDDATDGGVHGVRLGTMTAGEAGECAVELSRVIAQLQGLRAMCLAVADAKDVAHAAHPHDPADGEPGRPVAADTAGWLTVTDLQSGRAARAQVLLAAEIAGPYAATGSALLAGDIDAGQAEAICWALRRLPEPMRRDDLATVAAAEAAMLDYAADYDAAQLRRIGRRLHEVVDPVGAEAAERNRLEREEDAAAARMSLTTHDNRDGTTHVFATVPTRHAEMLRKALHAIANPALPDAICRERTLLDSDDAGTPGTTGATGEVAPVVVRRPSARVMGEALVRLLESLTDDQLPTTGGVGATVVVTMTLADLLRGDGLGAPAVLDTGAKVSASLARRLACQAGLVPAVLGGESEVLDLGRLKRFFTPPQRRALAMRQGHVCGATGCDRPAAWCEAHHLDPWSTGGRTDLDDGVLLCQRHHTLAHDPGYVVIRHRDHTVTLTHRHDRGANPVRRT